jgi:gephyrin
MRVGLLTISDRASAGTYKDESGPEMARMLEGMDWPLLPHIVHSAVVFDEPQLIRQKMMEWIDSGSIDLMLTSGGTGFGQRDNTPEAVRPMLHREAPGIAQALLNEGLKHTPLAVLSRPVAGTRAACFIATLPGSVKAVRENIKALQPLLPRIMELIITNTCSGHSTTGFAKGNATMCDCCK